jgi:protein gp37
MALDAVDIDRIPLKNVWLGVSVENQKAADDRLDYLCELGSQDWQTMVSFEPLLGAVDPGEWWLSLGSRTWAIVGGESGPGARPMDPAWVRGLRDQCVAAGVPYFFKQWGEWLPAMQDGADNPAVQELNCSDQPIRVGKKAAGALLDGVEWKQFPEVALA